ncbi:hypothetical protein RAS12_30710 (plasmid) [Achromobacter seleniivolatilans]|uniref:Uncharacterized protein n=1 Tax=Achromobacter seleniivolatilans TaxID=3047478 RepID=A0ABY9MAF6_9BURK|nr:hypothetical protein [Achromobacter sp. R39]WMD24006.1 hypothetical protein RAS12_30710 [Achromobacter sp. R39]
MANPSQTAQHACEQILIEDRRYNTEHNIWPSQVIVVDRLLARRFELLEAYEELHSKLDPHPRALWAFFDVLLGAAALWNPERIARARAGRTELVATNADIALKAAELAKLLRQREQLHNTSGFKSYTYYHVVDVIAAAARDNYLFRSHVQESLDALRSHFDLKYWPYLADVIEAIAHDAQDTAAEPSDPVTAAATAARRASLVDFFKAWFAGIEQNRMSRGGFLPPSIKLSDATLAALVNCALDLDPDVSVDGPYVKRLRQGLRQAQAAARAPSHDGGNGISD